MYAVPTNERLPTRVLVVEVSPRDGLQAESRTLPTETKLELIERLADAGHTVIEATSFVNPKAVPQLADAEELLRALKRRSGVRYPVLVPNEKGLDRALAAGADEIAVFASASETYSRKNLNHSRDEVLEGYRAVVRRANDGKVRVRGYLSMVIADPWDGPTKPDVVVDSAKRLLAMGCDDLSLGDTSGVGTPGEVRKLLRAVIDAGIPRDRIALHLHDTYGQALANALAAIEMGITTFDASVGGIGGSPFAKMAAGNLATEDLVWMCNGLGIETGLDVQHLAATSAWMSQHLGRELPGRVARALLPRRDQA
jgi:hydroxymethylglutaryl-CoA lyase